jgi:YjbE family integral membrane protein
VVCTFLVAQLLVMPYVKLIGGAVILWIAVKLLTQGAAEQHEHTEASGLWQALWVIVVADLSMGIDNMLAVGAASHGSMFLLLFGLGLSIPFVVFMSNMLSRLMDRYPVILWIGAGILGRVGGHMMITDPLAQSLLQPPAWVVYAVEGFFVAFVCGLAWVLLRARRAPALAAAVDTQPAV